MHAEEIGEGQLKTGLTKQEKREIHNLELEKNPRKHRKELFDRKQADFAKQAALLFGDIEPKKGKKGRKRDQMEGKGPKKGEV